MRISLFGNLRISVDGQLVTAVNTNRLHSLIAYLILHGDTPQPRERLAFMLWPASSESQARTNLRQLLHHLKRALPADGNLLVSDHFTVRWRQDPSCSIDAVEFEAAIAEAASAREENDRAREIRSLQTATQLYEDDLLPALYDDWLTPLREDYRRRIAEVLQRLATLFEEQNELAAAIPCAERLVALDALNESHHQLLIRLHAANHDRASALRAYHQCMRVLRRELGVEPGPATLELFERILKAEPETREAHAPKPASQLQKVRALIGRNVEWQRLASAWQSAMDDGPRVAVISGEPGIGKTRLADELYQSCIRQGHATARSRCYAGQGQVAYAPVAEWLRSDAVRAAWANLRPQQLAELALLVPEIEPAGAATKSGQPSPLAESWQRLHFYESLSSAFGKSRKPMLLFLDDMQWCDPDSFEWLHAFLTSPAARGVLVMGTVRSEETGREHPFTRFLASLRQSGMVVEIPLEPLDAQETAELARLESAKPLENANLGEIFRATQGNPLFVVESVRAGLNSTKVHAVIASRLAQLTPASYELAGLASVVGRPFSFELLEKATDWDEGSVSQALDELWRRRIVESRGENRGAAEYDFTHDRLREVACAELSPVRQRYWHRRVARALSEVYDADIESWDGQIASHFEQAGMAEEAIERYWRAANYARRRYADTEAADLLRRALALCRGFSESDKRLRQELDLLVTLGPALVSTEGYSAAEVGETYGRALDLSRRFDDRNIFEILTGVWVFHVVRGDIEKGRQCILEFRRAAEREPTPALMVAGNFLMGSCLFHMGQLEASLEHMTKATLASAGAGASVLELFAGPDIDVFCRSYLAHLAWHREDPRADAHAEEAIAAAERIRHPFSQGIALAYAALLHVFQGNSRAARERGRQAVELCRRHGFAYYLAMANVATGWAEAAEGEVPGGLTQLREGLDEMRRLGAEVRLPYYFTLLAETLGRAGQVGEALASLSTGFAYASKNSEEWPIAELHRVQGNLLAAEGKDEAARASYQRGVESAQKSGSLAFARRLSILAGRTATTASTERS
jgi:DNA-binding SARP family transcriptional activator/predicted ATPase